MACSFRPYSLDQADLPPQAPRDWLPEGHLAFFLEKTGRDREPAGPKAHL